MMHRHLYIVTYQCEMSKQINTFLDINFVLQILIVKYKNFRRRIELSADYINMDRT